MIAEVIAFLLKTCSHEFYNCLLTSNTESSVHYTEHEKGFLREVARYPFVTCF